MGYGAKMEEIWLSSDREVVFFHFHMTTWDFLGVDAYGTD